MSAQVLHCELEKAIVDVDAVLSLCKEDPSCASAVREDGSVALHVACSNARALSRPEVVFSLLEAWPEAARCSNRLGLLPLHRAAMVAEGAHILAVERVIAAHPAALFARTKDGRTPLHISVSTPRAVSEEVVRLLVQEGPQALLIADSFGQCPLHKAAANAKIALSVVELLVSAAPSALTLQDVKGFNALHWALSKPRPNLDVVFFLAEQCAEMLTAKDSDGDTPLMKYMLTAQPDREIEIALAEVANIAQDERLARQREEALIAKRSVSPSTSSKQSNRRYSKFSFKSTASKQQSRSSRESKRGLP